MYQLEGEKSAFSTKADEPAAWSMKPEAKKDVLTTNATLSWAFRNLGAANLITVITLCASIVIFSVYSTINKNQAYPNLKTKIRIKNI